MTEPAVLYEIHDRVGVITLNRPDNRNSMTPELLDEFAEAARRAREQPEIRCVVVTGRGRCFSGGADFRSVVQRDVSGQPRMPHERSYAMYEPFLSVLDLEVPVIAAMNGHAVGGGFGLALLCDVRIANRESRYGANFARLGIHSGLGISYLLPRLVGVSRAAELLFTGKLIDGDTAAHVGLASSAVPPSEVLPAAMQMAERIAGNAPAAVRMMKRSLYGHLDWRVRDAAMDEAHAQALTLDTEDAREGVAALLDKREPRFEGR